MNEGCFDLNEDPLNDPDIVETIYELNVTKIWIKGLYALHRLIIKDISSELHILESNVIPELFGYIDKYSKLFDNPDFIGSQIADGINATLEEIILFAGVSILKSKKNYLLDKINNDYGIFFADDVLPGDQFFFFKLAQQLVDRGHGKLGPGVHIAVLEFLVDLVGVHRLFG